MNRGKSSKTPGRKRRARSDAPYLQKITEHLEADAESAWYAERLEILGRIMFGDLWKGVQREAEDLPQRREDAE